MALDDGVINNVFTAVVSSFLTEKTKKIESLFNPSFFRLSPRRKLMDGKAKLRTERETFRKGHPSLSSLPLRRIQRWKRWNRKSFWVQLCNKVPYSKASKPVYLHFCTRKIQEQQDGKRKATFSSFLEQKNLRVAEGERGKKQQNDEKYFGSFLFHQEEPRRPTPSYLFTTPLGRKNQLIKHLFFCSFSFATTHHHHRRQEHQQHEKSSQRREEGVNQIDFLCLMMIPRLLLLVKNLTTSGWKKKEIFLLLFSLSFQVLKGKEEPHFEKEKGGGTSTERRKILSLQMTAFYHSSSAHFFLYRKKEEALSFFPSSIWEWKKTGKHFNLSVKEREKKGEKFGHNTFSILLPSFRLNQDMCSFFLYPQVDTLFKKVAKGEKKMLHNGKEDFPPFFLPKTRCFSPMTFSVQLSCGKYFMTPFVNLFFLPSFSLLIKTA